MRKIALLLFVACLSMACQRENCLYHQYRHLPDASWHQQDSLRFSIDVAPHLAAKCQESQALYRVQMRASSRQAYPYRNLIVAIESHCDSLIHIDTLDILQKENLSVDCPFELSADKFPYRVLIYHLMQDEQLPGLQSIGLEISLK